ncbi:hypothetical protein DN730_10510 [Marinomonas piezotolerans]|uniref:phosphoglycolate phosphatase n=1 Tax=Marinomonas piezotolerans TaxID=2213058 RepID=A0A370U8D7_9GAMM|nr:HAD-IA family hydrolase [Marinomonas piezotolerans]RDL44060.1 hypothetical protein DN730_10510 [Marinomonas piezotolerans]
MGSIKKIHFSFDLDGTLIDSIPLMKFSWERVNDHFGFGIDWVSYKENIGLPFLEICRNLGIEKYYNEVQEYYFNSNLNNIQKIEPMPGLAYLASELKKREISWSIITSKPSKTAEPILKRFELTPDLLVCSDHVSMGKPYKYAARSIIEHGNYSEVYYVGDSIVDFLFSINCNFNFIQYTPDCDDSHFLVDSFDMIRNHRIIVSSLYEVAEYIREQDNV